MSGSAIISPTMADTTLIQDGQTAGSITAADIRQINDSITGLYTTQQSGTTYTLTLADRGTQVESTSASATTFTVPPNSSVGFVINTVISFRQYGAGQLTIAAGAGVILRTASSLTVRARYGSGSLQQRAIDEWVVSGDMT
jgi:hypothetical protein